MIREEQNTLWYTRAAYFVECVCVYVLTIGWNQQSFFWYTQFKRPTETSMNSDGTVTLSGEHFPRAPTAGTGLRGELPTSYSTYVLKSQISNTY